MNLRFLGFIQIVMGIHALASIVVMTHLAIIGHWGFWVLLPFTGLTAFIQLRWGDIFKVNNPVTRVGDGWDYFVKVAKDIPRRGQELYDQAEAKKKP